MSTTTVTIKPLDLSKAQSCVDLKTTTKHPPRSPKLYDQPIHQVKKKKGYQDIDIGVSAPPRWIIGLCHDVNHSSSHDRRGLVTQIGSICIQCYQKKIHLS